MADVLPEGHEFGIVFAKENGIVNIGCTATVHRVLRRYEDGRLDILVRGGRRFEIESLDEGKSYLRAEIRYFDDEDEEVPSQELRSKALQILEKLRAIEETGVAIEPNPESSRLSFQVAQFIGDLDKRQIVLSLRSEVGRLEYLIKIVPEYLAQQEQIALAKRVGPLNGHAKHVVNS